MPTRSVSVALTVLLAAVGVMFAAPPDDAEASYLVGRSFNKGNVRLKVNRTGTVALIIYQVRERGKVRTKRMLAWGAVNAALKRQRHRFRIDRTGGWKTKGRYGHWKSFRNHCRSYSGESLQYAPLKCSVTHKGTTHHWAVQAWRRVKPNYGGKNGPMEYRLSHWTGPLPQLDVWTDWTKYRRHRTGGVTYNQYRALHLYGQYTYRGKPVIGKNFTRRGYVLDGAARNITLEAVRSDYPTTRTGWARVNMFLANEPNGQFCFIFGPKNNHGGFAKWQVRNLAYSGRSQTEQYRMGVPGPGVAPDVFRVVEGKPLGSYDAAADAIHNERRRKLAAGAKNCSID